MTSELCRTCGIETADATVTTAGPRGRDITRTPLCVDCIDRLAASIMSKATMLDGSLHVPPFNGGEGTAYYSGGDGVVKMYSLGTDGETVPAMFGYSA